ncbi:MAG TPA: hypothetical protein VH500_04655 [Nitrososphaeraceae archaeon]|jgi:hypothetical protein
MKELRSISSIFRRDSEQYDESALLYRDILVYPIKKDMENEKDTIQNADSITFTRWKIAKWLRSNHSIFVTRYENKPLRSPTEELVSIQNTIRRNLDRLVEIELLQVVGEEKVQKGTGTTPIYKHTIFGLLIARIIEYQNIYYAEISYEEKRYGKKIAADEIYNVLQSILKKGYRTAPSVFVLYSRFFEICKEQSLFGNLIQLMNEILLSEDDIITMENFIYRLMEFDFKKSENGKLLFPLILWNGSLNALDERTRNVFLHNVKLDIERKAVDELKNLRGYESLMLKVLEYPKIQVVLECNCTQCPTYILKALDVRRYKERMILTNVDPWKLSGGALKIYKLEIGRVCSNMDPSILPEKCPACNTYSIKIPFFNN